MDSMIGVLLRKASSRKFFVIRKLEYETDLNCPLLEEFIRRTIVLGFEHRRCLAWRILWLG